MNRIVSDERLQQILERGPIELRIGELEALVSTIKGLRLIIKDYAEHLTDIGDYDCAGYFYDLQNKFIKDK